MSIKSIMKITAIREDDHYPDVRLQVFVKSSNQMAGKRSGLSRSLKGEIESSFQIRSSVTSVLLFRALRGITVRINRRTIKGPST